MNAAAVATAFDPQRLRLARHLRGMRINELATRVGVTPAAVSQYENAYNRPSAPLVAKLSLALGLPADFFAAGRPLGATMDTQPFFRSLRSTPKYERNQAHAWAALCADVARVLERHVRLPTPDIPVIPFDETTTRAAIEHAANEVRAAWGVPSGPIADVVRLLEIHGIVVSRLPFGSTKVDAFSHNAAPRPVVVLTDDKADTARSRLDTAHELAHLVGHGDADRADGHIERQATSFGASLLAPAQEIIDHLPRRFDLATLLDLKATWGISIAALLYRSKELGVMTEPTYRRAVTWMSANGFRTTEPGDIGPPETPVLLARALAVVQTAGIPMEQIANDACLPRELLLSLINPTDRPTVTL